MKSGLKSHLPAILMTALAVICIFAAQALPVSAYEADTVAVIGDAEYTSVDEAVNAAKEGDTVRLVRRAFARDTLEINKRITLDVDKYFLQADWSSTSYRRPLIKISDTGDLTLTGSNSEPSEPGAVIANNDHGVFIDGGSFRMTGGVLQAISTAVYMDDNARAVIEGGYINAFSDTIRADGDNTQLTVKGGEIKGNPAVSLRGYGGRINITGGKIDATEGSSPAGVVLLGGCELNISGGWVDSGEDAVLSLSSESVISISGGTVSGKKHSLLLYDAGETSTVSGGSFRGSVQADKLTGFISGGYFDTNLSDSGYLAEWANQNSSGNVRSGADAVLIHEGAVQSYDKLHEAVAAAEDGDKITVLRDCILNETLTLGKAVVLDAGAYAIVADYAYQTSTEHPLIEVLAEVTLTGTQSSDIECFGDCAILIGSGGDLTIDGASVAAAGGATIYLDDPGAALTLNDGVVFGEHRAFNESGTILVRSGKLTINGGSVMGSRTPESYALIISGEDANAEIRGGTIGASKAVKAYSSNSFVITGGTFAAVDLNDKKVLEFGSGAKGVDISGGVFSGTVTGNTDKGFIRGGYFDNAVSQSRCAPGYEPAEDESYAPNKYTVKKAVYRISYDLDGGSLPDGVTNPESYSVEDSFTLNEPQKDKYIFAGWTGTGLDEATKDVTVAEGSTGNRSYKANWEELIHRVTLDANGGIPEEGWPEQGELVYEGRVVLSLKAEKDADGKAVITLNDGTKDEKRLSAAPSPKTDFTGIEITQGGSTEKYQPGETIPERTLSSDMTIRLLWETQMCGVTVNMGSGHEALVAALAAELNSKDDSYRAEVSGDRLSFSYPCAKDGSALSVGGAQIAIREMIADYLANKPRPGDDNGEYYTALAQKDRGRYSSLNDISEEIRSSTKDLGDTQSYHVIWSRPLKTIDITIAAPKCGRTVSGDKGDEQTNRPSVKVSGENCRLDKTWWVTNESSASLYKGTIIGDNSYKAFVRIVCDFAYYVTNTNPPSVKINGQTVRISESWIGGVEVYFDVTAEHGTPKRTESITRNATCTSQGAKDVVFSCPACDLELGHSEEVIPSLGHSWGEWSVTKAPTETEPGIETRTCSRCSQTDTRSVPVIDPDVHEHSWGEGVIAVPATCEERGEKRYTCSICGETRTEETEQLGHAAGEREYRLIRKANCQHVGYTLPVLHCKNCGEELGKFDLRVEPKTDHVWDAGVITKKPTSASEGEKTFTCTVCGDTRTEAVPELQPDTKPSYNELQKKYKPAKVKLIRAKKGKKKAKVSWKRVSGAGGYQIQVVRKKGGKVVKTVTVKQGKKKKLSKSVKKLSGKKKYKVRVRAFRKAEGYTFYGAWSKYKAVK